MSILIKGMEMPKKPGAYSMKIRLFVKEDGTASIWGLEEYIPHEPLDVIPVPPHGRLIDADALMARFEKEEKAADEHGRDFSFSFKSAGENCAEWWSVQQMLFDAPTIIPAEEGE